VAHGRLTLIALAVTRLDLGRVAAALLWGLAAGLLGPFYVQSGLPGVRDPAFLGILPIGGFLGGTTGAWVRLRPGWLCAAVARDCAVAWLTAGAFGSMTTVLIYEVAWTVLTAGWLVPGVSIWTQAFGLVSYLVLMAVLVVASPAAAIWPFVVSLPIVLAVRRLACRQQLGARPTRSTGPDQPSVVAGPH
jgi:hypothetical protein